MMLEGLAEILNKAKIADSFDTAITTNPVVKGAFEFLSGPAPGSNDDEDDDDDLPHVRKDDDLDLTSSSEQTTQVPSESEQTTQAPSENEGYELEKELLTL